MNEVHENQIAVAVSHAEVQLEAGFPNSRIHVPAQALLVFCAEREKMLKFIRDIRDEDCRGNSNPHRSAAIKILKELGE